MTSLPAAAFGCNTYSYTLSHTAEECLTHLAAAGFRQFELMMVPGHCWPGECNAAVRIALRRCVERLGAEVVTLNMPNIDMNVAGIAPEMRGYTIGLLRGIVELAGDLGVPGVVLGCGKANPLFPAPRERLTGYFFEALDVLAPLAKKVGTALWAENMPFAFLPRIEELMDALDRHGNPDIGIVWDAANSHFVKEDLAASLARCASRLQLVHLSDTDQKVYAHAAIGRGDVPFAMLPAALARVGYRRRTVLEITSPTPDADILASVDTLAALGYASLGGMS
jgi:L-ribulose-5-phosphate 3-epimerase